MDLIYFVLSYFRCLGDKTISFPPKVEKSYIIIMFCDFSLLRIIRYLVRDTDDRGYMSAITQNYNFIGSQTIRTRAISYPIPHKIISAPSRFDRIHYYFLQYCQIE